QKLCLPANLARDDGLQPPLSPSSSAPSFPPSQRACVGSSAPQTACNRLLRVRAAVGTHADQSRLGSRCIRLSLHCNFRSCPVLLDAADLGPYQKVSLAKDPASGRWLMPPSRQLVPVGRVWRWSAQTSAATRPAFARDPYSLPTRPKTAGRALLAMRLSQMLGLFDDLCLAQSELTSDTTLTTTAPDSLGHFRRATHLPAPLRRYSFRDLHIFPHSARPTDGRVQTLPMELAPQHACIVCDRHSWREIGNNRARRRFQPIHAGIERLVRRIFHFNLSRRSAQLRMHLHKTVRAVLLYNFCPKPN
ncbi:Bgt-4342, partial [Blumeria graminis f. sp. tritici]